MMRVFVAVPVADEVKRAAADVVRALQQDIPPGVNVRWVPPENMHLTVRFIGHVPDNDSSTVLDALRPPLPLPPFDVSLGSCGLFPRRGPPRVVWLGLADGLAGLRAMHDEFNRRLAPFGFEPESRDFTVHLTLARVKEAPGGTGRKLRECVTTVCPAQLRWRVTAAMVFQSLLSPKGATYRELVQVPCRA